MDYVDSHSYWHHPNFPHKSWDPVDWTVEQEAMVDHPASATLPRNAADRLAGKPFTVSEYNHPAPNDYQAECVPLLAAYAAAQDWDGVWLFAYSHSPYDANRDRFGSFFDIDANPAKWGFMQAGAAVFRDAGIPPLAGTTFNFHGALNVPSLESGDLLKVLAPLQIKHGMNMQATASDARISWENLLKSRLFFSWTTSAPAATSIKGSVEPRLAWKVDAKGRGEFVARGPGAVVLVGHAGASAEGIEFSAPGFAAITVTTLDGRPIEESRSILITACGRCENTDMQFSADRRTVGNQWGKGPVRIEPVAGSVILPSGSWRCKALAPDGRPLGDVPVESSGPNPLVKLSPAYRTMWYLVTPRSGVAF